MRSLVTMSRILRQCPHVTNRAIVNGTIVNKFHRLQCAQPQGMFQGDSRMFSSLANVAKEKIVPDVLDNAPNVELQVKYGNLNVNQGNIMTPTQVQKPPTISWKADSSKYYLLCMTDPDAPSRAAPEFREWHHWLVGNIPGDKISSGEVLSDYIGAGPPQGTGLHRYIFLVYEQPGKLNFTEQKLTNRSGDGRGKFAIRKFTKKYSIGSPIAINFFQAEWDDYVPKLYEQLSGK